MIVDAPMPDVNHCLHANTINGQKSQKSDDQVK